MTEMEYIIKMANLMTVWYLYEQTWEPEGRESRRDIVFLRLHLQASFICDRESVDEWDDLQV
jgi:hypothetical protein